MCLKAIVALQRIKMSKFYPEPYEPFGGDINVTIIYVIMQQKLI